MPHARRKRNWNKQYYGKNKDEILAQRKEAYTKYPEAKKIASKSFMMQILSRKGLLRRLLPKRHTKGVLLVKGLPPNKRTI